ncbi:hypothetical protein GCM10027290_53930 [Micromonospora sonneratiae]|uniref:DUF4878 domain-containing protein n=2 Tax=Micromonospora sonneratiae TaxID=1184706 RepID=A0ABW3YFV9_9ACTN
MLLGLAAMSGIGALFFGPASAVEAYFDALADRDPEAALENVVAESVPTEYRELLQGSVLDGPDYTPPSDMEIVSTEKEGDKATVEVSYALAGKQYQITMKLVRSDESTLGMFRRWHITNGLFSASVSAAAVKSFVLNGKEIVADEDNDLGRPALIGAYKFGVGDNRFFEAEPGTLYVTGVSYEDMTRPGDTSEDVEPGHVRLTVRLKEATRQEIDQQIDAYLNRCAESADLDPDGCPFSTYIWGEATEVSWKITRKPTIEIAFSGSGLVVDTETRGEAEVSYNSSGTARSETISFRVRGIVSLDGEKLVFNPQT